MAFENIIAQIDAEIAKLVQVRALLASTGKVSKLVESRKVGKLVSKGTEKPKKARVLSPEARKRIADAQRKRWAAQKAKKGA